MATEQGEEVCAGWRVTPGFDNEVGRDDRSITVEPVGLDPFEHSAVYIEHEVDEYSYFSGHSTRTVGVSVPFEALAFLMRRAGWTVVEPGGRMVER